jgi:glutamine amidotransferase
MIAVISYGVCNVGSILSMLRRIGAPAAAVSTPAEIERAEKIILPGIGAFDNGMSALTELGLAEPLRRRVAVDRVPILGICLGLQLLGNGSEEGVLAGLGLLEARCVQLRGGERTPIKVPHMGWNVLASRRDSPLLADLDERARFYFVHSYHLVCTHPDDVLATVRYGTEFTAMIHRGNVWGAQFHPEKSHRYGMTLLRNFARL